MKILLSAFACDPLFGSDEEVGWQWALRLTERGHDVTVVTRQSHQEAIEQALARLPSQPSLRFIYVDLPRLHAVLSKVNRRNHIYYYAWQWFAAQRLKRSHGLGYFDVVHHVTWVSFRQPSFMGALGQRSKFGPVAGGDNIPSGLLSSLAWRERLVEHVRGAVNKFVRFDPLMTYTYASYDQIFFTSQAHLGQIASNLKHKCSVELAIGSDFPARNKPLQEHDGTPRPPRLLFAGRCIGWKGMDLGIRAFAEILKAEPFARLTLVGDGSQRPRWEALARMLGVNQQIDWLGWLKKAEVEALYPQHDLLLYPSLRDSGGFVVLEALAARLPVACYELGGPGVVIDRTVGELAQPGDSPDEASANLAKAALNTLYRARAGQFTESAFSARVSRFSWSALIDRIYPNASNV
jgi:glycosyltransferase involved in cell wall biosynthesis